MSVDGEKHWPALGGQPRQNPDAPSVARTAERDLHPADSTSPTSTSPTPTPPTPVDEYSKLVKALYEFAPNIHEVVYSEQTYTRSFEIESAGVWERFVATLQPESAIRPDNATILHAFIEDKLRFWIDLHPRDGHCLLHLNMQGPGHDMFGNVFMTALSKRLDAIPTLFPDNEQYLTDLRRHITDTGSDSWRQLSNKKPDMTLCFGGMTYGIPGIIVEIGNSQNWEGNGGVKNKAIQYEEDSEGTVTGVLYLDRLGKNIAMIGSKDVFPDCPRVKYLDGTLSTHAVEVIPLTSLTDPAYAECLLSFKFAYFGPGAILLQNLTDEEQNMGFFFTFKEILQMMESIDKSFPLNPLPIIPIKPSKDARRWEPVKDARPWEPVEAIRASLFKTPPDSPPYCTAQADVEDFVEYPSTDEEPDGESSDKEWKGKTSTGDKEGKGKTSTGEPVRQSARLAHRANA